MKIAVLDGRALEPDLARWQPIGKLAEDDPFDWYPVSAPEEVVHRATGAQVIVINKVRIDAAVLDKLPDLKLIAVSATGYDNVDVAAARARNVTVCNVPEYSTDSVAQHVFAMLLSFIHTPLAHHMAIDMGKWQAAGQFTFWLSPLMELKGKNFGIVGFGRIGQATARLAKAFGMNVLVHSRTQRNVSGLEDVQWLSLEELVGKADITSLHCPATPETERFVNRDLLQQMQPQTILINTARGSLINESDLADALKAGTIAGACLDVLSSEPPAADNPLVMCENCLLTPHNAWTTTEARSRLMRTVGENIQSFFAGKHVNVIEP